jgi:hypothetical protein
MNVLVDTGVGRSAGKREVITVLDGTHERGEHRIVGATLVVARSAGSGTPARSWAQTPPGFGPLLAEDHRRVPLTHGQGEMAFGDLSLDLGAIGEGKGS